MAYPESLPVRSVSFGQAVALEGGSPIAMRVTIKASRTLVHRPSGTPLVSVQTVFRTADTGDRTVPLPVTDSDEMGLGNGQPIVLETGEVTHLYTATIEYLDPETLKNLSGVPSRVVGPFALPSSSAAVVDLDDLQTASVPTQGIPSNLYLMTGEKGAPGGLAPLGADTKVPALYLPAPPDLTPYSTTTQMTSAISAASTADRVRSNHTGQTTAAVALSDFVEAVQDVVGGMMLSGGSLTFAYDDAAGKATYTATGVDAEAVRDALGVALVGTNGVTVAPNDAADTIVIGLSGVTISQITNLQSALDGKAPNAHTHTQTLATMAPGGVFTVYYSTAAASWQYNAVNITARPTARTDLTMMALRGTAAPAFKLDTDLWLETV